MSQSDPTDHALAAIASILDQPEVHREEVHREEGPREVERPVIEPTPAPPPLAVVEPPPAPVAPPRVVVAPPPAPVPPSPVFTEGEGYSKIGPGPIAALRFKWTARRADNGDYFVDETIGERASPIVTGPMTREAAIRLVDEREEQTRLRFEQLRHEMTGRVSVADLVRRAGGEA